MISQRIGRRAVASLTPVLLATGLAGVAHAEALSAGAGRATFDIPSALLPLAGFSVEHDKLASRVLVLDNGARRVAVAVVDLTSIGDAEVTRMKGIIQKAANVDPANALIVAGHTFSAPHMANPGGGQGGGPAKSAEETRKELQYNDLVEASVLKAATTAAQGLRPAKLGFGTGRADVNVSRNMPTADGWWLGSDDSEPSDKSVQVLRFDDASHRPIAVLLDYAVQPSIMDQGVVDSDGGKAITSDLGGAAVQKVEDQYGGDAVSMFLVGAAGDQAPTFKAWYGVTDKDGKPKMVDIGAKAYPLIDLLGGRLGAEALRVSDAIAASEAPTRLQVASGVVKLDAQERPRSLGQIHATKTYNYNISGKADAPYYIVQVGDVALVGVQVELSAATGEYIKAHSPFKKTMVITMVNGAAKYLPDAAQYKQITYESMNSSYGPGSAEILSKRILQTLAGMRKSASK